MLLLNVEACPLIIRTMLMLLDAVPPHIALSRTCINNDFVFFMKNVVKKRVVEREKNSFKEEGILRRNYCMEGD